MLTNRPITKSIWLLNITYSSVLHIRHNILMK